MAYNGSGTFNRVYNWATDKTNLVPVTASRMDAELDGIATGLSTAIAKDGQTATTARVPFAAGASAFAGALSGVSYSFSSDPNTGLYSPAADQFGLVAGGVATLTSTATVVTIPVGAAVTGDLAVTGALTVSGAVSFLPAGIIVPYAGSAAPTGWLVCDGSSLLRASYAALFTAISTTYGAADGSHFTLPDLTGRTVAGKEASATRLTSGAGGVDGGTLGAVGGTQTHALTTAQLAAHTHTTAESAHAHNTNAGTSFQVAAGFAANVPLFGSTATTAASTGLTINSAGSDTAHPNVQPTIVLNYIIKT